MKVKNQTKPFLNIPIGYCAICFPPSVKTFVTSSPCTVMKQYDAARRKIEKKTITAATIINNSVINFNSDQAISKFTKAITITIIA